MTPAVICIMPNTANRPANTQPSGVRPAATNMPPPTKGKPFKRLPKMKMAAYSPAHTANAAIITGSFAAFAVRFVYKSAKPVLYKKTEARRKPPAPLRPISPRYAAARHFKRYIIKPEVAQIQREAFYIEPVFTFFHQSFLHISLKIFSACSGVILSAVATYLRASILSANS